MNFKKQSLLFISMLIIAIPANAKFNSCPEVKDEEERKAYTEEETAEFSEHIVRNIRLDLRLAKHVTDRYVACLKNDEEWIKNNQIDYRDKFPCEGRIKGLRNRIKSTFPRMRLLMSLAMTRYSGSNPHYKGHLNPEELTEKESWKYEPFITRDIQHHFKDLAELEPLTIEEVKESFRFLHSEEEKRTINCGPEDPNMEKTIHNTWNSPYRKACYARHYKGLLFGDDELGIRGFPLIAFLKNEDPTDEELIEAMNLVLSHLDAQIEKVESEFYNENKEFESAEYDDIVPFIHYQKSVDRYLTRNPYYCDLADNAQDDLDTKMWYRIGGEMAVILGGMFACGRIYKTVPFMKGMCQLPFGLGANLYFVWYETSLYDEALQSILIEPDGNRNLVTLDQLDGQELARFITLAMLPIGTGLPELFPKLREGLKPLKRFLMFPLLP